MISKWKSLFIIFSLLVHISFPTSSNSLNEFNSEILTPSPQKNFKSCNRPKASYVCDPDGILSTGEVDKLDNFIQELSESTPCLCSKCPGQNVGAKFGVFIKNNLTINDSSLTQTKMNDLAKTISYMWKLGKCTDDIIVAVLTKNQKSSFYMGLSVQYVIPSKMASEIFNDCAGHFENENYYQGLESMINSFRDVLQRFQKIKPAAIQKKSGAIIGIALGVCILFGIVITAIFLRCWHLKKRLTRKISKRSKRSAISISESLSGDKTEYNFVPEQSKNKNIEDSISDEGIDSDSEDNKRGNKEYELLKLDIQPFSNKCSRQLSLVPEENQEEEGCAMLKCATNNKLKNCNAPVTEL